MLNKDQMESLSELFKKVDYTRDCIMRSNDDAYNEKFLEVVDHILELTLHVKQLQLEILALEQRCERRREEVYAELRNIVPGAGR